MTLRLRCLVCSGVLNRVIACGRLLLFVLAGTLLFQAMTIADEPGVADEPFRPEAGLFPPLEKAHRYRGELVFVDHANRRGSIRVQGDGMFFRNDPHPFAMLPYGVIRYHTAAADLRDIPLGTVLHVYGYLPPDPRTSAVPVLPVDNKLRDANHNRGAGIFPAENHVLLLEDEPSHCQRLGLVWKLVDIEINQFRGAITARREPKAGVSGEVADEQLTFDAATRVWRGRERLTVEDLVAEGTWPASGKQSLQSQTVTLGIMWKPTPEGVFTRFHISDIWLDDVSLERAAQSQAETHKAFLRARWMPAFVGSVEYGEFGRAIITATLFGGMEESLYADFKAGVSAMMNGVEDTLKHTGGNYGPAHMASRGTILEVTEAPEEPPLGSSGIQIRFETDLVIEAIRPGRVVRVCPGSWPQVNLPREEFIGDGNNPSDRFPSPDIFPRY